jgi:hypothetical protein
MHLSSFISKQISMKLTQIKYRELKDCADLTTQHIISNVHTNLIGMITVRSAATTIRRGLKLLDARTDLRTRLN